MSLGRRLGIVRRVADDNGLLGRYPGQLLQRRFEDIRMWFGSLGIIGRGFGLEQILDPCDFLVSSELIFFSRRGERDALAILSDPLEKIAHFWECFDSRHIFFLKERATILVQFRAELVEFTLGEKNRQQLIGAFADLSAYRIELHFFAEFFERFLPRLGV